MNFYDRLKGLLGFTNPSDPPPFPHDRVPPRPPRTFPEGPNFEILTDPSDIHKFFEQQMSEMMKGMGFGDHFFAPFGMPEIEESPVQEHEVPAGGDLRDHFLKSGFEKSVGRKVDEDMDGKLDVGEFNSLFGRDSGTQTVPQVPRTRLFGQSITSRTIRNADGSLETHRTVRDNEGNEETTITRKMGDKEYTVVKKRDKSGQEEIVENLVNMDEREVEKFKPPGGGSGYNNGSLFDKLFK